MSVINKKETINKSSPKKRVSISAKNKSNDLLLHEYREKLKEMLDIVDDLNKKIDSLIKDKNDALSDENSSTKKQENIFADSNIKNKRKISLSYNFDNMPIGKYYSKYKRILRAAYDTTVIGNLEEGLNMFKTMRVQHIPKEYKDMIEKNIEDIAFYMKSYYYTSID